MVSLRARSDTAGVSLTSSDDGLVAAKPEEKSKAVLYVSMRTALSLAASSGSSCRQHWRIDQRRQIAPVASLSHG
jgi:hypothetical protein